MKSLILSLILIADEINEVSGLIEFAFTDAIDNLEGDFTIKVNHSTTLVSESGVIRVISKYNTCFSDRANAYLKING